MGDKAEEVPLRLILLLLHRIRAQVLSGGRTTMTEVISRGIRHLLLLLYTCIEGAPKTAALKLGRPTLESIPTDYMFTNVLSVHK